MKEQQKSSSSSSSGIGFCGLLTVAFIVLKLTGYIDWSWWLVTAPLWGGVILAIVALIAIFLIIVYTEHRKAKKKAQWEEEYRKRMGDY